MSIYKASQRKMADLSDLEQYIDKDYSIHFSYLTRLGINPQSKHITPIAVCGYPLTLNIYHQMMNISLPFAQYNKYMHLYRIKDAFNISNYSEEKFQEDLKKILELVKNNSEWRKKINYDDSVSDEENIDKLKIFGKTYKSPKPFSIIWNIGEVLCDNPRKWNALFRALGYNAIVDYGYGLLHLSEPYQTMVFNPSSIEEVKYYISPSYFARARTEGKLDKKKIKFIENVTDPKVLEDLAKKFINEDFSILKAILNNPHINQDEIHKILISNKSEKNSSIREDIAEAATVNLNILEELAMDEDIYVRSAVAKRSDIPEKIQKILIEDKSYENADVRECVAENTNVTDEILEELIWDTSEQVRSAAQNRIEERGDEKSFKGESKESYFKNEDKIIKLCTVIDLFYREVKSNS